MPPEKRIRSKKLRPSDWAPVQNLKRSVKSWGANQGLSVGSTGEKHPWRAKSQRMITRFERQQALEASTMPLVALEDLELYGVPVELLEGSEELLGALDAFEAEQGLEHAGVDRVLERFEKARYDHEEYNYEEGE